MMAVAQVFIPDTPAPTPPHSSTSATSPLMSASSEEDNFSPFPRAPPPSPEQQQRSFGGLFDDVSLGKLEQLQKAQSSPSNSLDFTRVFTSHETPIVNEPDPLSPSEPCAPPTSLDVDSLPPLSSDAHLRLQTPSPEESLSGVPVLSYPRFSHSVSSYSQSAPPLSNLTPAPQPFVTTTFSTSPEVGQDSSSTPQHLSPRSTTLSPEQSLSVLSQSNDLHCLHPHLPASLDTVSSVPGSMSSSIRSGFTDSGFVDDSCRRKRKVSLKRKNDEVDFDSSLQFSFEYSYSSSCSGDSDWVVLDSSNYPLGKKACQDPAQLPGRQHISSSVSSTAHSHTQLQSTSRHYTSSVETVTNTSPVVSSSNSSAVTSNGFTQTHAHAVSVLSSTQTADVSVGSSYPSLYHYHQSPSCGTVGNTALQQMPYISSANNGPFSSLTSVDSLQPMDYADSAEHRLDSLDSMDTGSLDITDNVEMDSLTLNSLSFYNTGSAAESPLATNTCSISPHDGANSSSTSPPVRSHSSAAGSAYTSLNPSDNGGTSSNATPRLCQAQHFFSSYHQQGDEFLGFAGSMASKYNFSKSL